MGRKAKARREAKTGQHVKVGRHVCFVGGPLAGDVRTIPESVGEILKAETGGDYFYRIFPVGFSHRKEPYWFAYDAQKDPSGFLIDMWNEYCPSAKIKRGQKITQVGADRYKYGG